MATSGTFTFTMSALQIVEAALRQTGRFGASDVIPAGDIANCLQALNIIVKAMVKNQKPLWCVQRLTIPLLTGVAAYDLALYAPTMPRPLRVLFAFIRNNIGQTDTEIMLVARDDYSRLGQKSSPGVPNQAYYDPQLTTSFLTLYNVPFDNNYTLFVDIQRQIQDLNLLTDNPDFPQEAFRMLKWTLAEEIMLEYLTPMDIRAEIIRQSNESYESYFANERENVSTFFTPSERTH